METKDLLQVYERIDGLRERIAKIESRTLQHTESCPGPSIEKELAEFKQTFFKFVDEVQEHGHAIELDTKLAIQKLQTDTGMIKEELSEIKRTLANMRLDFDGFKNIVAPQTDWINRRRGAESKVIIALIILILSSLGSTGIWIYLMVFRWASITVK